MWPLSSKGGVKDLVAGLTHSLMVILFVNDFIQNSLFFLNKGKMPIGAKLLTNKETDKKNSTDILFH